MNHGNIPCPWALWMMNLPWRMSRATLGLVMVVAGMLLLVALPPWGASDDEAEYRRRRESMVARQIENRGVVDPEVLEAMRSVPRHLFVPPSECRFAYEDRALPIACGQTISQPYIVALMTELIEVSPSDRVLEVGTGSGYQSAVLGSIVDEVYTVEIYEELGRAAHQLLRELGYTSVHTRVADGYYGWPKHAPFDAIMVTCAIDHIPPPLLEQLAVGGRMCLPLGHPFMVQRLVLVTKEEEGVKTRDILPVGFVPMLGGH